MADDFLGDKTEAALADLDLDTDAVWAELDIATTPASRKAFLRTLCGLLGINPRGTYNAGTAYKLGDAVVSSGNLYRAKGNTTGNAPPNGTYWTVVTSGVETTANKDQPNGYAGLNSSSQIEGPIILTNYADNAAAITAGANVNGALFTVGEQLRLGDDDTDAGQPVGGAGRPYIDDEADTLIDTSKTRPIDLASPESVFSIYGNGITLTLTADAAVPLGYKLTIIVITDGPSDVITVTGTGIFYASFTGLAAGIHSFTFMYLGSATWFDIVSSFGYTWPIIASHSQLF